MIPVLTKAGCNAGSCHGAALGRGGFRLSLLGYDPGADHDSLVHEFEGRRVNTARPERSLVLRKGTAAIEHEGGPRLAAGGEGYRVLRDWIAAGAPRSAAFAERAWRSSPARRSWPGPASRSRSRVTARYDDGTPRTSRDGPSTRRPTRRPSAARRRGESTALRRGRSAISVRFLGAVGCATVTVPLSDSPPKIADRPRANFVDDHVNRTLDELRLDHAPRADDATYLRRARLDLTGQLPSPAEVDEFLADRAPGKHARLVERLLASPEFVDHWAYKWGDLLRIESGRLGAEGAAAFHGWVRDAVARNTPLDRMAREMILALGDGDRVGPANFSRVASDARSQAELVSQVFLGVRLQCANCHDHPLDRWTRDDYHGLAAVFARVDRGRTVRLRDRGEVIHPGTGLAASPRIPGERPIAGRRRPARGVRRVADVAGEPVLRPRGGQPHLARADGPRPGRAGRRPPRHQPPDASGAARRAGPRPRRARLRHARTRSGRSWPPRPTAASSRRSRARPTTTASTRTALARPLPPHVLVDAVARVTGVPEPLGDLPPGRRRARWGTRGSRRSRWTCSAAAAENPAARPIAATGSLGLALHAINGPWLNAKLADPGGRLHRMVREGRDDREIVAEFYRLALGRGPRDEELAHWTREIAAAGEAGRLGALEDFAWALLLSPEFTRNH